MYSNGVHTKFAIKKTHSTRKHKAEKSFPPTDLPKNVWEGVTITKIFTTKSSRSPVVSSIKFIYEGWNFNSGNYLFTTDTK